MRNRLCIVVIFFAGFFTPVYAQIASVHEAMEVVKFLDVLKEQHPDAFTQKNIRYAVEEVLALYESSNDFTPKQRAELFDKLRGYLELMEEFDAQNPATRYLNPDQSLVSYWTQLYAATHTILDTNNSSTSNALNLIAPIATGFNYSYTLQMPVNQGSANQVLMTDGNNPAQLSWVSTVTSSNSISLLNTATSCDNYGTLVLRDATGNFAASTITLANSTLVNYNPGGNGTCPGGSAVLSASGANANTITLGNPVTTTVNPANNLQTSLGSAGAEWSTVNTGTVVLYDGGGRSATLASPAAYAGSYSLTMPTSYAPGQYQVLANVSLPGANEQLGWITTVTSQQAINLLYSATYCDIANTLVLRDGTGNIIVNTVAAQNANGLLNYTASSCSTGTAVVAVPGGANLFVGQFVGNNTSTGVNNIIVGQNTATALSTGNNNSAHGNNALTSITTGTYNSGFGGSTLNTLVSGSGNTALGYGANVSSANATNQTAIGAGAVAPFNNSVALGNTTITAVVPTVNATVNLGASPNNLWNAFDGKSVSLFDSTNTTNATLTSPANYANSYTLQLPTAQAAGQYQVLGNLTVGGTEQLGWITTVTSASAINLLYSATYCDIANTLVLRDTTGSFVANNITFNGSLNYGTNTCTQGQAIVSVINSGSTIQLGSAGITSVVPYANNTVSLGSAANAWSSINTFTTNYFDSAGHEVSVALNPAAAGNASYTVYWPQTVGTAGYVLEAQNSGSPTQLAWIPVSTLLTGTYCDVPNMVVARDSAGSFAATTITLTSQNLLNFNPVFQSCPSSNATTAFLSIPGTNNLFLGQSAGAQGTTGSGNLAVGRLALTNNTAGSNNTALGYNAGSASTGSSNIYIGSGVTGNSADASVINIGVPVSGTSGTYINGIFSTTLPGVVSLVGVTSGNQLGVASSASITTLTVTTSLYVDSLNGAVIATNGLLTATTGAAGTRLADFVLTDTPAIQFFQPVEPSRESYFFDDFLSFNNTAGDMFYGDTQWVIGNNTAARVSAIPPIASNGAIGVTRLTSGAAALNSNYLTKQLTGTTSLSLSLGYGPCLNEWRVAVPAVSTGTNSFYTRVGFGDSPAATATNPTGAPSNGIYFQAIDSVNSGNWTVNTASNGLRSSANTTVAPTAGVFQRLSFQVNGNASSVTFYINDTAVGTITTNIPNVTAGNYCSPYASVVRNAGSGGSLDLDYWYFHYTFNTRR